MSQVPGSVGRGRLCSRLSHDVSVSAVPAPSSAGIAAPNYNTRETFLAKTLPLPPPLAATYTGPVECEACRWKPLELVRQLLRTRSHGSEGWK